MFGPRVLATKAYFTESYVISMGKVRREEIPWREGWPLASASVSSLVSLLTILWALKMAALSATVWGSTKTDTVFSLMIPSNQEVSIVLSLNSGVSKSLMRYSTVVLISPRTSISFRAKTRAFLASSRVGPEANRWPNWESANSWIPPLAPTEKYPHTLQSHFKIDK